jgi:hypothetical protein
MVKTRKFKRGQMKIQQMSFMLIAVFLFFALVGMIVLSFMLGNIRESATTLKEQNAKLLVSRMASSPELWCGEVYGREKTDCIDLDKAMALKANIREYSEFWKISSLEIQKIYPKAIPNKITKCTVANYPNCNMITLINKKDSYDVSNYVALCRKEVYNNKVVNTCELGKITVGYEGVE